MEQNAVKEQKEISEETLKKLNVPGEQLSPDVLYQRLADSIRRYHPSEDVSVIEKAYRLASEAHKDGVRKSGEPYIIHPIQVATILADLELDKETIVAGILHDVVEDTDTTLEDIRAEFGDEIAELVDGVTKLTKLKYSADKLDVQAENLRKMFLAMAKDIRVILIKLADRLHNMRTLQYMTRAKQIEKARETLEIYAPLAQRLGISKVKDELDDLALKYLEPDMFFKLEEDIEQRKQARETFIEEMVREVAKDIEDAEIKGEVKGRVKHLFSVYKKMVSQDKTIDEIYDLFAVRIIVDSIKDCYAALGVIHEIYKPIPGRFKDYIAMPKPNLYQSLHTTVISHSGQPFEVQIRTYDMHRIAEYGIAAHWKYKEGKGADDKTLKKSEEEKIAWLRRILDWQQEMSDNKEFMDALKSDLDLFSDMVFVFTPEGDVKNLPAGSTPIDFAYSIHSAVGNKMVGARVNDRMVTIDYKLQNGDRVEIITSQNSHGPSRDWLNIVKSSGAKSKINQWFRNVQKDDNIAKGKDLVEKYMKAHNIVDKDIFEPDIVNKILPRYSCKDVDSLLASIGHGGLKEGQIVNRLLEEYNRKYKVSDLTDQEVLDIAQSVRSDDSNVARHRDGIVVKGIHDVAVKFSKCCSPLPGDEIVGYVTRGRGITVHRTDCINILNLSTIDRTRLIDAEWDKPSNAFKEDRYEAAITIYCENRIGLLVDITKLMSTRNLSISTVNVRTNKQNMGTIDMGFKVSSADELNKLLEKMRQIDGILDIQRTTG